MKKTISTWDEMQAMLQDQTTWPRQLKMKHTLSSDIVTSGLCATLKGICFFYQKAELTDVAHKVFQSLSNVIGMEKVAFYSAMAFRNCKVSSLLYRTRISESLVSLRLVNTKFSGMGRIAKALSGSRLERFTFMPTEDMEDLSALLLLNLKPIPELNILSMKTIKEGFFLKQAMKIWRKKGVGCRTLTLTKISPKDDGTWMHNFICSEMSRNPTTVNLKGHPDYFGKGKILWAENESLVEYTPATGVALGLRDTEIIMKAIEE